MEKLTELRTHEEQEKYDIKKQQILGDLSKKLRANNIRISKAIGMSDEKIEHIYTEIKLKYQANLTK